MLPAFPPLDVDPPEPPRPVIPLSPPLPVVAPAPALPAPALPAAPPPLVVEEHALLLAKTALRPSMPNIEMRRDRIRRLYASFAEGSNMPKQAQSTAALDAIIA
jgi:hypothetical protein